MDDLAGQQLGNYRLLSLLGQGAFASVYLGEHIYLGTKAAIKVLHVQAEKDTREHFQAEARTIAHLDHPHIVRVLDFGIEHEFPFLVMSYVPGGTLRQRHPKGTSLPLDTIVSYIQQIAQALQYAHLANIIHRDIKPENMLLDRQNTVLLSDFGIALTLPQTGSLHTQAMAGTAPYMAPEQIMGKPRPASDQYALGIVAYEWLCGARPFSGNEWSIAYQHLHTPPPSFLENMPSVPPSVEAVVFKALAKEWMQRFASVQDFARAFEQACQGSADHPTTPSLQETSTSLITHQLNLSSVPPIVAPSSHQNSIPGQLSQNNTPMAPPTDQSQQSTSIIYPPVPRQQPQFVSTPQYIPPNFQQFPEYVSSEQVTKKQKPTTGRTIILTLLLLVLITGGVIGYLVLGQHTGATQSLVHTTGVSSPTLALQNSPTLQSSPTYTIPLGSPEINHVSLTEVADGQTIYTLLAQVVDQSAQSKPVHASDITCKLWLVQKIPDGVKFGIPNQTLQNVNALQGSITGTVQGQPFAEVSGITFDSTTPQTHVCNANGQGIWQYRVAASVPSGTYSLVVLTDWRGIHWNWRWLQIVMKT